MRKLLPLILSLGVISAKGQVAELPPTPLGMVPPRPVAHTGQILIQEAPPSPTRPRQLPFFYTATDFYRRPPLKPVPVNHATADFGFFCRQELKMDRRLPLLSARFRLGSQQQADELDGKR